MFLLKISSDFAYFTCFRAFGSLLNIIAPENLNVLFPRLSFTMGMCRSSFRLVF